MVTRPFGHELGCMGMFVGEPNHLWQALCAGSIL